MFWLVLGSRRGNPYGAGCAEGRMALTARTRLWGGTNAYPRPTLSRHPENAIMVTGAISRRSYTGAAIAFSMRAHQAIHATSRGAARSITLAYALPPAPDDHVT